VSDCLLPHDLFLHGNRVCNIPAKPCPQEKIWLPPPVKACGGLDSPRNQDALGSADILLTALESDESVHTPGHFLRFPNAR
jgi:hypothetical protein